MTQFVRDEVEPIDLIFAYPGAHADTGNGKAREIIEPLRQQVRAKGLWACHLGPELGGKGYGQVKLALMNEILGRSKWAPTIFGTAAPDTGNAEILAMFGTQAQKAQYLQPLLDGKIVSCFSMTEPQAGSDPREFTCSARKQGDEWVINGEKWFSSHARFAEFFIIMAVTDPSADVREGRLSMFIAPADTPGIEILRNVGTMGEAEGQGTHGYMRYNDLRLSADALLGEVGKGFQVAQARLGGGRVHHAMRVVGKSRRAFDMMRERAVSRRAQGQLLAQKQLVRAFIADSAIELEQFRLLVLQTAWKIDNLPHGAAKTDIAMCKVAAPKVQRAIVDRAIQLHGSLGVTTELPLAWLYFDAAAMSLVDGPTEVHKMTVAKAFLKDVKPAPGLFPSEHVLARREAARDRYAEYFPEEAAE
jgi:acyl-CoA dehydrogenase